MRTKKRLNRGLHIFVMITMISYIALAGVLTYPKAADAAIISETPILSIIKSVDKAPANPSDTLSYTITISNSGNKEATNIFLLDTLPSGLTFADMSFDDTTIHTWDLGTLAAGADVTVKYNVLIDSLASVGTYTNTAIATAYDNNEVVITTSKPATASTEVKIPVILDETAPVLTISKSMAESFVNPGGTVTYTVTITNNGDAPAMNAVLVDVLPPGFVYAGTADQTTATWELGDIVPTESITTIYEALILGDTLAGNYVNTATIQADDLPAISDTASVEVKAVQVLGAETDEEAELPVTGMNLMGFLYLIAAGLVVSVSVYLLRLTFSKKQS